MSKPETTYFKFHADNEYPLYIGLEIESDVIFELLTSMNFRALAGNEIDMMKSELSEVGHARQLLIKKAGPVAIGQIDSAVESDLYGHESIVTKQGYKVYRYKSVALIVYSYAARVWECGVSSHFASSSDDIYSAKVIINRFMSWAFAPMGVVGFWAQMLEDDIVILKQNESNASCVYIDLTNKLFFGEDFCKSISGRISVIRLEKNKSNKKMNSDELLSFLSVRNNFFDPTGNTVAIRQILRSLCSQVQGLSFAREDYLEKGVVDKNLANEA